MRADSRYGQYAAESENGKNYYGKKHAVAQFLYPKHIDNRIIRHNTPAGLLAGNGNASAGFFYFFFCSRGNLIRANGQLFIDIAVSENFHQKRRFFQKTFFDERFAVNGIAFGKFRGDKLKVYDRMRRYSGI